MTPQMHELLLALDRAKLLGGDGWVSGHALRHIPRTIRNQAQTKQWMVGQGSTSLRKYRITTAGRTALANNAEANLAVMDEIENGYVPTGEETPALRDVPEDPMLTVVEPAAPLSHFPGLDTQIRPGFVKSLAVTPPKAVTEKNNGQSDPRARACVQAIDILSEDFPEVGDLVNVLMKLNARKDRDHE